MTSNQGLYFQAIIVHVLLDLITIAAQVNNCIGTGTNASPSSPFAPERSGRWPRLMPTAPHPAGGQSPQGVGLAAATS